jgi:hypothetical protein
MEDFRENVIEFVLNSDVATCTFYQQRYVSRIKELAKKKPDKCKITAENSDGSIVAHIPVSWIRINPEKELSDEQRQAIAERLNRHKMV